MAFIRKIKGSLVRKDSSLYDGEDTYLFYDIDTGCIKRSVPGVPGGENIDPLCMGFGTLAEIQDEGIQVSPGATLLNFAGAGVTVTEPGTAGELLVTISGGGSGITVEDEGAPLAGLATTLDFVGTGVVASGGGATKTITITGGGGPAYGTIIGDTGSVTSTTSTETITFGGSGIDVVAVNAGVGLDTIDFNLDIADLPDGAGAPALVDTIAINIGGLTEEYPLSALSALFTGAADVYENITGGDGGTATAIGADTITFNGTGISIVATNAGAGLDTIAFGLDIADLPAGAGPLTGTDTIAVNDGGTTEEHSIEDVVEAVLPGVTITTINGQPMLTLEDTTRANKILSVGEQILTFAENALTDLDWVRIGNSNDADSGFIADFDGTIVYATGHCEDTGAGISKDIRIYIDAVDTALAGTLSGGANATFNSNTLNVDFSQGDKIRLRAIDGAAGAIQDTVVKLTVKWRG